MAVLGDRYELRLLLGSGGMAQVHLAHDLRLDRAIAAVYDTGEHLFCGAQLPYLVMEYVDGTALRETLHSGPPPTVERAVKVTAGVLAALVHSHSHQHGIVHRDIKPANVMLTWSGQVKVMDFGIARDVRDAGMTQTSLVIGTARYLSPEQATGHANDARPDLRALTKDPAHRYQSAQVCECPDPDEAASDHRRRVLGGVADRRRRGRPDRRRSRGESYGQGLSGRHGNRRSPIGSRQRHVDLTAHDIPANSTTRPLPVTRLAVGMDGPRTSGSADEARARSVRATACLSYADVSSALGVQVSQGDESGRIDATPSLPLVGDVTVSAVVSAANGNRVGFTDVREEQGELLLPAESTARQGPGRARSAAGRARRAPSAVGHHRRGRDRRPLHGQLGHVPPGLVVRVRSVEVGQGAPGDLVGLVRRQAQHAHDHLGEMHRGLVAVHLGAGEPQLRQGQQGSAQR